LATEVYIIELYNYKGDISMKSKFSLFIAIMMVLTLVLGGCVNGKPGGGGEIGLGNGMREGLPSGDNSAGLNGEEDVTDKTEENGSIVRIGLPEPFSHISSEGYEHISTKTKGTYEYKGIIFPGDILDERITRDGVTNEKTAFFFDRHYLLDDFNGGRALCQITNRAALAYVNGDFERLSKYMCNDGWIYEDSGITEYSLDLILLDNVYKGIGSEVIIVLYFITFDGYDSGLHIGMDVYLNDDGEWKIKSISIY
jgi:hypothetical protein